MSRVEFLIVPQQQQKQQQQSEASADKSPSNHVAPKHSDKYVFSIYHLFKKPSQAEREPPSTTMKSGGRRVEWMMADGFLTD